MDESSQIRDDSPRVVLAARRYVTVLFSDLSDSSQHAESLEAEDYAEVLATFRRFADEIVPRHGGIIARAQGDGVLAIFGHLAAREDDGRRATEAALELHEATSRLSAGTGSSAAKVRMHSGIHAGLVLLGEGDIARGRIDVVGDVPNTAARLCSLAASGEVMVSAGTLGPHAHFFRTTAHRVEIRGRSAALQVLLVNGRASITRRIDAAADRGTVPFIGRGSALAILLSAAGRTREGFTTAVVVVGEPGIGKTRLIDEFQRSLDRSDFRVLQGYCESYLGAEPLQPFMQMLRAALEWQSGAPLEDNQAAMAAALDSLEESVSPEVTAILHGMLSGSVAAASMSLPRRAATIVALLTALARNHALVLVLDDWQWADDSSREALTLLRRQPLPLMMLLSSRVGGEHPPELDGAVVLPLAALTAAEGERAIAAWLPGADPFMIQELYRQSGGSPLYIEELCHAAAATGSLNSIPRGAGVPWLNALVASRLARLPGAQAECLRVASVAGNAFPMWLLERLIGADEMQVLDALAVDDFLIAAGQPGMLRFKHGLTRDAVYATVDLTRRRALHLRVAESLEVVAGGDDASEWLEALSYHYDAAGRHEQAAQFAEAAGDKALAAMALDRARAQYMTALHALDAQAWLTREMKLRWCGIAQKLGQTCVFDPLDVSHGLQLFQRAATLAREADDENCVARAEYWLGYVNYGRGSPRMAVRHCEAALEHAIACGDERLVAQVRATLGQSLASAGRYERALPLLSDAVASKRKQSQPGSRTAIGSAYTLGRMAYTFGDLGRFDEAYEKFDEALALLGTHVHSVGASVRELKCVVYLWHGRWEEARQAGLEGADIALRCRSQYLHAMGRALAACGAWELHHDAASLRMLREATHWIETRGGAVSTSLNYGWLVEASIACGEAGEARAHAVRLFVRARAQDRHGEAIGCRALARLMDSRNDGVRANRYLDRADRAAGSRGSSRELAVNHLARAEIAMRAERPVEARSLLKQTEDAFGSMGMVWHLAKARELLTRL